MIHALLHPVDVVHAPRAHLKQFDSNEKHKRLNQVDSLRVAAMYIL